MTPDGSYVIVYTQDDENSTGETTTQTIHYSVTPATTDTAGPTVADVNASATEA